MVLIVLTLFIATAIWIGISLLDVFVTMIGISLVIVGFLTVSAFLLV